MWNAKQTYKINILTLIIMLTLTLIINKYTIPGRVKISAHWVVIFCTIEEFSVNVQRK